MSSSLVSKIRAYVGGWEGFALPPRLMIAICISQIAQGVNFTVPFSIAVYMVRSFDPAAGEELIARRTGYLASSFMLATFLVSIPWGYVSDRMGRKPVVVIGQSAASISMVLIGSAGSYEAAVGVRFLAGLFNGVIGAIKCSLGESMTVSQQTVAFSLFSMSWGLGTVLGPMIAGWFSDPCAYRPCAPDSLFFRRPFALPCFISAAVTASSATFIALTIQETHPRLRRERGLGPYREDPIPWRRIGRAVRRHVEMLVTDPGHVGHVVACGMRRRWSDLVGAVVGGPTGGGEAPRREVNLQATTGREGEEEREQGRGLKNEHVGEVAGPKESEAAAGREGSPDEALIGRHGHVLTYAARGPLTRKHLPLKTPRQHLYGALAQVGAGGGGGGAAGEIPTVPGNLSRNLAAADYRRTAAIRAPPRPVGDGDRPSGPSAIIYHKFTASGEARTLDFVADDNDDEPAVYMNTSEYDHGEGSVRAAAAAAASGMSTSIDGVGMSTSIDGVQRDSSLTHRGSGSGGGSGGVGEAGSAPLLPASRVLSDVDIEQGGGGARRESETAAGSPQSNSPTKEWHGDPQVLATLAGYTIIALVFNMADEALPIFASTPTSEGGLGFTPRELAWPLSAGGITLMAWAMIGFPLSCRYLGVVRTVQSGCLGLGFLGLLVPLASLYRDDPAHAQRTLTAAVVFKSISNNNAFAACIILVNAAATAFDPNALGVINGVGQSLASGMRAVGPTLGGVIWSVSLAWGWGHQWYVFVVILVFCLCAAWLYEKVEVGRPEKKDDREEEKARGRGQSEAEGRAMGGRGWGSGTAGPAGGLRAMNGPMNGSEPAKEVEMGLGLGQAKDPGLSAGPAGAALAPAPPAAMTMSDSRSDLAPGAAQVVDAHAPIASPKLRLSGGGDRRVRWSRDD